MNFLIATVPHTGTNFLARAFAEAGFELRGKGQERQLDNITVTTHIDSEAGFRSALKYHTRGYSLVTPIRHPFLVAESWIRRNERLDVMIESYKRLPGLGALFIPIDSPYRDRYVDTVNRVHGISLKPNWGNVVGGFHGTHDLTYREVNPPPSVIELAEEMKDFINPFYEDAMIEEVETEEPKKRGRKPKMIECIAVKRVSDEDGNMVEPGEVVMKKREDAIVLQDAGAIKIAI